MKRGSVRSGVIAFIIALILGFIAGAYCMVNIPKFADMFTRGKGQITARTVRGSLQNIAEVATQQYTFTRVGEYKEGDMELFDTGIKIPLTKKKFSLSYTGNVKAGLKNAKDISVKLDRGRQTAVITVPKSQILSAQIEPGSVVVIDQTHNILNQLEVKDVTKFEKQEDSRIRKEAVKKGILKRADKNMRKIVRRQAETLLGSGYEVTVKTE
jgi:hypothetical protein